MSVKKDFDVSQWQSRPIRIVKISEKILYFPRSEAQDADTCLYTVFIQTNLGSVEMKYIESHCNSQELDRICFLLKDLIGISSLINRMMIELESYRR
jgi:predicted neuraminidase